MEVSSCRVVHVISNLGTGGAEQMLWRLVSRMDRGRFHPLVISLTDIGSTGQKIQALGVPVRALGMRPGLPTPVDVLQLARWLRRFCPDVIQTWMYHADLIGGLAAKMAGAPPVTWGIHSGTLDPRSIKRSTLWTVRACARLSRRLPTRIVCCSEASQRLHTKMGYPSEKIVVIPNGFDLATYRPNPSARLLVRRELGIPREAPLVGLVARFHPMKDHLNFIQAAALVRSQEPEIHFLLCGDGVTWENPELVTWIERAGLRYRFHLLGRRDDIPQLNSALDVASSSSYYGEAFPLAIGEAMACGVPCVVTDVGDSALIVGETGCVVPPQNPEALAAGWRRILGQTPEARQALGRSARRRIEARFALETVVCRYEHLYEGLCQ